MTDDQKPQDDQHDELVISEEPGDPADADAAALQEELEKMTSLAKRAAADLANYKRHIEEQRADMMAFANKRLLEAIFPAIDNLSRAASSLPEELAENEWAKGVLTVERQLIESLTSLGLAAIEETGVPMDPHKHEVLMEAAGPKGEVIQIFEKGYSFNGKTIRAAKVQVGNGE